MHKDRSRGEDLLQDIKCYSTFVVKISQSILSSKTSEWNYYVWIIENETPVKVGES